MTADERRLLTIINDELRSIALQIETFEHAFDARMEAPSLVGAHLAWRLADYYRMETHLKETRAKLLALEVVQ